MTLWSLVQVTAQPLLLLRVVLLLLRLPLLLPAVLVSPAHVARSCTGSCLTQAADACPAGILALRERLRDPQQ